jgi:hypothetical protein
MPIHGQSIGALQGPACCQELPDANLGVDVKAEVAPNTWTAHFK